MQHIIIVFLSQGIGCYMFRIDADEVVDATMSGNEARFINHACEVSLPKSYVRCPEKYHSLYVM